jgi:hypothetical protein
MIRRAQPLPKPPADMLNNGSIEIVAPFVYSLEKPGVKQQTKDRSLAAPPPSKVLPQAAIFFAFCTRTL